MSNLKISPAEAFLAALLVSGGVVVFVIASNYRGVVEAKVSTSGVEFRVDGRELPKSLPGGSPSGVLKESLGDKASNFRC